MDSQGEFRTRQVGDLNVEDGERGKATVLQVRESIDRRIGSEAGVPASSSI
jgi:hypothetical protein